MITQKPSINRLKTGVPGLDEALGGGLPEYSFNLIAGPPGCGKTTLAHQIMFSLATPERPALYFTALGEPPLKILRYQQQFDFFDLDRLNRCIRFVNLADEMVNGDLDQVLQRIASEVEHRGPGLVVVDSFRSLVLASQDKGELLLRQQHFIHRLGMLMTSWQATTFLIGEYFNDTDIDPIFTVADGLIWLRQSLHRNSMVRKLEIVKMRGQASLPGQHSFRISNAGVQVFSPPALPAADAPPPSRAGEPRLRLGIPELDAMLGGGLPRGYSLLVAGPSGSGKSILAASFLAEGARLGEKGIIAAFEQRTVSTRNSVMAKLIASGDVSLADTPASDLSVDEVASLLIAEIHRCGATRLVIDSLSGFELALAPTFNADFRESLSRLVWALAETGVTVLMTSELEDRYSELRFSPYGTAFLTDAIIVQRYVEIASRLERITAVVKVRGSNHSKDLRLFHIDDKGIQIGGPLTAYEGLLVGKAKQSGVIAEHTAHSTS